jgi:hypothetical protein
LAIFKSLSLFDCENQLHSLHTSSQFAVDFPISGEVTERLKVHAWNACVRKYREFESLPLRQSHYQGSSTFYQVLLPFCFGAMRGLPCWFFLKNFFYGFFQSCRAPSGSEDTTGTICKCKISSSMVLLIPETTSSNPEFLVVCSLRNRYYHLDMTLTMSAETQKDFP